MKFLPAQLSYITSSTTSRRNLRVLLRFLLLLVLMTAAYSVLFHVIMEYEGQDHSWVTGLYWALTVMSTLGFGDITFQSDLGRIFSLVVLVSGVLFLLIVLPFTFIQFFYAPWLEAQTRRRVPRQVDDEVQGHVLLTSYDPVAVSLIERLRARGRPYYLIEPDLSSALGLEAQGVQVVLGAVDDLSTYHGMGLDRASMVVANVDDFVNTNIAFTVRELDEDVPIVGFARDPDSVDVLQLAGSSHVIQLTAVLGRSLARRIMGGDQRANVVGRFDDLVIAEAPVAGTPLIGRSLGEGWLRSMTGLTAVGAWERGRFATPGPETRLKPSTILVLAGTDEQLATFAELTAIYQPSNAPVLVLGGGRVGRAAARALLERGLDYRIVEKNAGMVHDAERTIVGNAADLDCLEQAGIRDAPSVLVTTSDDATNIYLTIYCRRLRPDIQIISRATHERNVSTLHRAGADFVLSYASMGANAVINVIESGDIIMVAEGLDLFRVDVPPRLRGMPLRESDIRAHTGCNVVAFQTPHGTITNPPPEALIPDEPDSELILVGTTENELKFREKYGEDG